MYFSVSNDNECQLAGGRHRPIRCNETQMLVFSAVLFCEKKLRCGRNGNYVYRIDTYVRQSTIKVNVTRILRIR